MPSIAAFLSFACIMSFTPGPNNIMALSCASTYGLRKSLRFCFGVLLGVLGIMAACALFGATLFRFLPDVEPAMRAVGAAYILWMACGIWRSKAGDEESRFAPTNGIVSGILLQLFNPKGMLYGMTAFSSFVLPYYDSFMPLAVSVAPMSALVRGRSLGPYSAASSKATMPPPMRSWRFCWSGAPSPCMFKGPSWVQSVFLGLPTFLHSAIQ